jgi:hypothetical protein
MDNTKLATHKALATVLEKQAIFKTIEKLGLPFISRHAGDYAKELEKLLYAPMREKGTFGGIKDYVARQFTPVSYSQSLLDEAAHLSPKIEQMRALHASGKLTPASEEAFAAMKAEMEAGKRAPMDLDAFRNKLQQDEISALENQHKHLLHRAGQTSGGMGSAYKNLYTELMRPGTPKGHILSEMGKLTGHNALQAMNMGFMWGTPALGAYSVSQAPEGEKLRTAGQFAGETLGFLAGGPLGIIPGISGSLMGNQLGGKLMETIAPPTAYQKFKKEYLPQGLDYYFQEYGRPIMRGVGANALGKGPILGALPEQMTSPQIGQQM